MALMTWDKKYSVGVKAIDSQHSVLFKLINDLHDAMLKGEAKSMTGTLLKKLADYTQTHFVEEEKMMEAANYAGLAAHQAMHRELIKKVEGYSARFERGEATLNLHLMNFLRDWLTKHILDVDHQYGPCLNNHGIK
jgi:hemerythrin-like metal-binding protein